MKVVYMASTLGLLSQTEIDELLGKGVIKELEGGFKYIVIEEIYL
jgi:hypothetical protein